MPYLVKKRRWEKTRRKEEEHEDYGQELYTSGWTTNRGHYPSGSPQRRNDPSSNVHRRSRSSSRNRTRSGSRHRSWSTQRTHSGATPAQQGGALDSKTARHSSSQTQVSWADTASGQKREAGAESARIQALEKELAQIKHNALFIEEIKKT
ncbi:hypothetical protein HPB50_014492 [Hyalomma asiaticum]|uniref:Uncharacterized protein n=1 Tax=Hyalomma asiaticum TaxID=266040 RepID=A0ACB7SF76_HYAAI|nr:hypothetical protein HPB50_014492 [Hyalomma asiaticum]